MSFCSLGSGACKNEELTAGTQSQSPVPLAAPMYHHSQCSPALGWWHRHSQQADLLQNNVVSSSFNK